MKRLLKKLLSYPVLQYFIATLAFLYLKLVSITTRWTYVNIDKVPKTDKVIIISWHNRILMTHKLWHKKNNVNFIVSPSKDGRLLNFFLWLIGGKPYVGSSGSKTGTNPMKSAIKLLNSNKSFSIAPDGSRGPRYHMKAGVSFLMQKTNTACLLSTYNVKRRIVLSSWDNMIIPLPFNHGVVMYDYMDNPDTPKNMNTKDHQKNITNMLEDKLTQLTKQSDAYYNHPPIDKA